MTTYLWADACYGTLAASVASGATSASVNTVQGTFPIPATGQAFTVVFNPNTTGLADFATTERVTVIANSSGNFTFSALAHNHVVGEYVVHVADANSLTNIANGASVTFAEQGTTPTNPPSGTLMVYANTANQLKTLDPNGNKNPIGAMAALFAAATFR